jgi:glycerol-3-phosphate dehydrogenase subunit C
MVSQGKFPWRTRLRNNLLARSELLGKVGGPLAPLANAVLANKTVRWGMDVVLGIHRDAPLPAFSSHRFTRWHRRREKPSNATRQVVYFHGCATEYYEPRIGRAAVQVLEANGFEVIVPKQNCCGLPLLSNGEFTAARRYHANNVRYMAGYARQGIPIVGTSTSCTLTIKEEAPELLDFYTEDARLVASGTFDLNEFLLELWEAGALNLDFRPLPLTLAYHEPCQYRAHRLGRPAVDVLSLIPELTILESKADCCGIAGTYGYKTEKYQIGMDVGAPLFDFARRADSPVIICDSETCRWQITHGTGLAAIHPVELLAVAYGFRPEGALADLMGSGE